MTRPQETPLPEWTRSWSATTGICSTRPTAMTPLPVNVPAALARSRASGWPTDKPLVGDPPSFND